MLGSDHRNAKRIFTASSETVLPRDTIEKDTSTLNVKLHSHEFFI
jgi:hypothetical protein